MIEISEVNKVQPRAPNNWEREASLPGCLSCDPLYFQAPTSKRKSLSYILYCTDLCSVFYKLEILLTHLSFHFVLKLSSHGGGGCWVGMGVQEGGGWILKGRGFGNCFDVVVLLCFVLLCGGGGSIPPPKTCPLIHTMHTCTLPFCYVRGKPAL